MSAVLLPIGLAFIMLTIGLSLGGRDFAALARAPRAIGLGLVAQVVALPAAALGVATLFNLSPTMTLGLLILAAAPGGITSNFLTFLARADAALSITMTVIASLFAAVTIPLAVRIGALVAGIEGVEAFNLPFAALAGPVLVVSAVPLLLGMVAKRFLPGMAARVAGPARRLATLVFVLIVLQTFYEYRETILANWQAVGPAVLALNVVALGIGLVLALVSRLPGAQAVAIAVECGLQNVALALFVATGVLGGGELAVPAILYAVAMNLSVIVFIIVVRVRAGSATALARD